jgi:hypothetical protein
MIGSLGQEGATAGSLRSLWMRPLANAFMAIAVPVALWTALYKGLDQIYSSLATRRWRRFKS